MDSLSLCTHLGSFYASLRKENGEELTSSSLSSIRYSLARHLKSACNVDIMKDVAFTRANEVFKGKMSKLKRIGNGTTNHFDRILDEDLNKIAHMPEDDPQSLQLKVWFHLQFHFAQRGNENIHSMKKHDLQFIRNENNKTEIHLRDFLTKNHREQDSTKSTEAFIVEIGGKECPVALITKYISLLNEDIPYIWQRANKYFQSTGSKWYMNAKVGENIISKMMKRICDLCKLSRGYTNHCVRATAITILARDYQDTDIQAISGHKSLGSLGIYKRTPKKTIEAMSSALHKSMYNPSQSASKCGSESAISSSHHNCCISYGSHVSSETINPRKNKQCTTSVSLDNPVLEETTVSVEKKTIPNGNVESSSGSKEITAPMEMTDEDWANFLSAYGEIEKKMNRKI
jgi:hypothetical protein